MTSATNSIRVLLADDQENVRSGFRFFLEAQPDITVVGEASDGQQAVDLALQLRPDVALVDIRMPKLDGLEVTRQLIEANRGIRVVVVTTFDLDEYVYGALQVGASGFILKHSGPGLLVEAVRAATTGDALVSPSVTVRLLRHLGTTSTADAPELPNPLTGREIDILRLVAQGHTNSEIAATLFLSLSTVKTHLSRIQQKLHARNRVEIAAWAWQRKL